MDKNDVEALTSRLLETRLCRNEALDDLKITERMIESLDNEASRSLFLARSQSINAIFDRVSMYHGNIRSNCVKLNKLEEYTEDVEKFNEYKETYYKILAVKTDLNRKIAAKATPVIPAACHRPVKLPDLELPTFNGSLKNWQTFFDTFHSLIHSDATLSDIDKYHYLVSVTKGTPNSIVTALPLVAANYQTAWQALVDRYSDTRVLSLHYLDSILKIKPLTDHSYESVHAFYNEANDNILALNNSKIPSLSDFILLSLLLRRVDDATREKFELKFGRDKFPAVDDFLSFLRTRCQALEVCQSQQYPRVHSKSKQFSPAPKRAFYSTETPSKCPHCRGDHRLTLCNRFLALDVKQRRDVVRSHKLCFNCFANSHMLSDCSSKFCCRFCDGRHHSLIHFTDGRQPAPLVNTKSLDPSSSLPQSLSCSSEASVLLGTAIAHIRDNLGRRHTIRTVIDCGSQLSFITLECATRLSLNVTKGSTPISGLGNSLVAVTRGTVQCELQSPLNPHIVIGACAVILPKITTDLPNSRLPLRVHSEIQHLPLADPDFDRPGPIDFLVGADLFPHVFLGSNSISLSCGLSAMDTIFGWILMGKINNQSCPKPATALFSLDDLQADLKRFWQVEEPSHEPFEDPEDLQVEEHFVRTHYRDDDGRYVVSLPFKKLDERPSGNFGKLAHSRLFSLESRFRKKPQIRLAYNSFMKDYLDLGHMVPATQCGAYLIPHHCVFKDLQSLSKIRVVFDASAKPYPPSPGVMSLNEALLPGPKLQRDISEIILHFRCHQVVFTTDICKMYRQILVAPDDRRYQHILWRNDSREPVKEYELVTVTYGLSCAPFLALRVLQQLAHDERRRFPEAARVLSDDVYVDDIVTGAESVEAALRLKDDLIQLLGVAGFSLKKWSSNSPSFLEHIPPEDCEPLLSIDSVDSPCVKILGLQFESESDAFTYALSYPSHSSSKRSILSDISRIFDPLGWISPVVFFAKRLMQDVWKTGLGWDDPLPQSLLNSWFAFREQLPVLSRVKIPRPILPLSCSRLTIVGFCDASQDGYAAVIYLRTESLPANVKVSLLKSKTRVSPLKSLSIPRLELCAAVLLSHLLKSLRPLIEKLSISQFILCSDSTIVLNWLSTPPHRLKTFVANRVVEVTSHTQPDDWRHVESESNPADCASRGLLPEQIVSHTLWWHGPPWLIQQPSQWPIHQQFSRSLSDLPDVKPSTVNCLVARRPNFWIEWIQRFSSLLRLQFSMSFVLRFVDRVRRREGSTSHTGFVSSQELQTALHVLIKHTQQYHFADEITLLQAGQVPKRWAGLSPFLDPAGMLRMGGRLEFSRLSYSAKHPLLLPKEAYLTALIVSHFHKTYLHVGPRTLRAILGKEFWILSLRQVIRRCIAGCLVCAKLRARPITPLMGQLPSARVTPSRPFLNVGTDFAGPFRIKESSRRNARTYKAYFCVFICMATKATHIEAVTDLSTEAFLAAFDRFTARRGLCEHIFSDCGTNFVGASRCLGEFQRLLRDENRQRVIGERLAQSRVTWHFIPPAAPHFGGLWEAAVKSIKYHLVRVIGDRPLLLDEFITVLSRVEAILNSRPLYALSSDPEDVDYLTPGHFLIGTALLSPPEPDYTGTLTLPRRWQLTRQIAQHVWRRWSAYYLQTLQARSKWTESSRNIAPGDLVFLIAPNTTPLNWPCGRVKSVFPGKDAVVRVAEIQTATGVYKRPVAKLVRVPSQD